MSATPLSADQTAVRDREWVERIRTGDAQAFEAMYRAYKNHLGAFLERFLRSREPAEEVVQELFLHIWDHRHTWEVSSPLNIYLFRAARNRAISYLRHERVETKFRERVAREDFADFVPRPTDSADEGVRTDELRDAIERAVSVLPDRCQEVFRLNRYHHLSYSEVAELLHISVKTVELHMGRALTALRVHLASWRE
jgi:RNA polymerase sigma-19 factor, ECF subfamily